MLIEIGQDLFEEMIVLKAELLNEPGLIDSNFGVIPGLTPARGYTLSLAYAGSFERSNVWLAPRATLPARYRERFCI